jgi:hypothetical protein
MLLCWRFMTAALWISGLTDFSRKQGCFSLGSPLNYQANPSLLSMKTYLLALTLAALAPVAFAETGSFFDTSFESPSVTGRTPKAEGGDPTKVEDKPDAKHPWQSFDDQPSLKKGGITAGLTTEMARTGDQSFFIKADKLGVPYQGVVIASQTFPITPAQDYIVHIWGRNDAVAGFSSEGPQLYMKLEVDFFGEDGTTQVGDSEYLLQPLPGAKGRKPFFTVTKWSDLSRRVTAPSDAKFMLVMWRWEAVPDQEPVSGTMYFDDVSVVGEKTPEDEKETETPAAQEGQEEKPEAKAAEPKTEASATPAATGTSATPVSPAASKPHPAAKHAK